MLKIAQQYQKINKEVYYFSLLLIIVGLFFSRALISIGFFLFFFNWFLDGAFKDKWLLLRNNYNAGIVSLILFIHVVGMLNTSDIPYGLSDLKIKLPLLLPLFFISAPKLIDSFKKDKLLLFFLLCTIIASIYSVLRFEQNPANISIEDLFKISITGQNIQVSMFANFAIFILYFYLFISNQKMRIYQKLILIASLLWLVVYIYLLNSLTGFIILSALLLFCVSFSLKNRSRLISFFYGLISIVIFFFLSFYFYTLFVKFSQTESIDFSRLEENTKNGNFYEHDTISKRTENGNYINIYICRNELERMWEKRSKIPFKGKDLKGQEVAATTIRYLSSMGLRKDSAGLAQLSASDIVSIESGCANYLYTNKYSIESRAYNIYWQLKTYEETGNSTAQSISQRIEFLKAAKILIRENFWFGVGTGDVMNSFRESLNKMKSKLDPAFFNRVHNQYIVEMIALGIFGFLAFIFIIFYPVFRYKIWNNYLFSTFYIIILISFLTDNPLETQLGVSFFSIFFSILIAEYLKSESTLIIK